MENNKTIRKQQKETVNCMRDLLTVKIRTLLSKGWINYSELTTQHGQALLLLRIALPQALPHVEPDKRHAILMEL